MHVNSDKSMIVDQRDELQPVAVVAEPLTTIPAPVSQAASVETVRSMTVDPSAIIAGIVGVALLVLGGITAARAGFDGPFDEPVVTVAGYTATALLGVIELGFGLFLVLAAVSRSQGAILFVGIIGLVASLVAVFEPSDRDGALALERGLAVWFAVAMAVVVISALIPSIRRRSSVRRVDVI